MDPHIVPKTSSHRHGKEDIEGLIGGVNGPYLMSDGGSGDLGRFTNTTNDALFRVEATAPTGKGVFFHLQNTLDDYRTYEGYGPNFGWMLGQNGNSSPSFYVETLGSGRGVERAVRWGYDLTMQVYGALRLNVFALTDAATIAIDASKANVYNITLGGNRSLAATSGGQTDGQRLTLRIKQDGTGSRTLTWDATYRFNTTFPSPTLTTTGAKTDIVEFLWNATDTKWDCVNIVKGI